MEYIINPETGRQIRVGGTTYNKIIKDHELRPKKPTKNSTKGWSKDAPKKGTQRHILNEKCGSACFLLPKTEAFPICPRCDGDHCQCKIDCRGLTAAKIRAHQYKYVDLYDTIQRLEMTHCKTKI